MYYLLGLSLALAALLAFNAAASGAAALLWRIVRSRAAAWPAPARAQVLFALRVLPFAFSAALVCALVLPAYFEHEPRHGGEHVGAGLAALVVLSASGLALAARRGLASWLATRRLVRDWLFAARPVRLDGAPVTAFRIEHPFPVIALVGALRPRLFIAAQVLDALTPAELRAAVAHECGHLAARDNLKRALTRACRDALSPLPFGRALDRAWAEEAERAADEFAAGERPRVALDLASALVKIARLAPAGARPAVYASSFIIDEADANVAERVRRLARLASHGAASAPPARGPRPASLLWLGASACLAALIFASTHERVLLAAHELIEQSVRLLR
jgi:Zn-dependent protease with chaperone function